MKKPTLPPPDAAGAEHCGKVMAHLHDRIRESGPLRFDRFWDTVMFAPGLGYYVSGTSKFGAGGDFVTAPELGPVFAQCMATQLAEAMACAGPQILELGAGSGAFACDALHRLATLEALPEQYLILEPSAELAERQRRTLAARAPALAERVVWLTALPSGFSGVIFGNEVMDAIAPRRVQWTRGQWTELHVDRRGEGLAWVGAPLPEELAQAVASIEENWSETPPEPYRTEIQTALAPWFSGLAQSLARGAILMVDYGYPRSEYYHAQRSDGTLICHYRHHAHADPFVYPGLTDLSVSVDFSRAADGARAAGMQPFGYTHQTYFLAGAGLDEIVMAAQDLSKRERFRRLAEIKRLTLPNEMGDRFKVMAASKNCDPRLSGFSLDNRLGWL